MGKMPNIIPITDLRQDAAGVLQRVRASREPIFITQRGRAVAVMVSAEEYEDLMRSFKTRAKRMYQAHFDKIRIKTSF